MQRCGAFGDGSDQSFQVEPGVVDWHVRPHEQVGWLVVRWSIDVHNVKARIVKVAERVPAFRKQVEEEEERRQLQRHA